MTIAERKGRRTERPAVPVRAGFDTIVVIVNYRSAAFTVRALASLRHHLEPGSFHAVVVENDSGDEAELRTAFASERFDAFADLVIAPINGGFAYGNNVAIEPYLRGSRDVRRFWLLNPDTELMNDGLSPMIEALRERPRAGFAGSCIFNADGSKWPIAFRFPSLLSELEQGLRFGPVSRMLADRLVTREMGDEVEEVDWMPGASVLVRREVFEDIGLMDEAYFLYYEETDFFLEAARAGWSALYVPASRVRHIAGQSTGVTGQGDKKRLPDYWFESRRRYFEKNFGLGYAAAADLLHAGGMALHRVRTTIMGAPNPDPPHALRDHFTKSTPAVALRRLLDL